jgi:hypothetical protein
MLQEAIDNCRQTGLPADSSVSAFRSGALSHSRLQLKPGRDCFHNKPDFGVLADQLKTANGETRLRLPFSAWNRQRIGCN